MFRGVNCTMSAMRDLRIVQYAQDVANVITHVLLGLPVVFPRPLEGPGNRTTFFDVLTDKTRVKARSNQPRTRREKNVHLMIS